MIKPTSVKPIAFSGAMPYQNRKISPAHEVWEELNQIFVLKSDNIDCSSLSAQNGELCYDITLKDGTRIKSVGKKFLELKNKSSRWCLLDSDALVFSLKLKLASAIEHLGNIWLKVPS